MIAGVGAVVVLVAAFADQIGIGTSDDFGWKQITGVVIGALIIVLGWFIAMKSDEAADGTDAKA
jgi:hypothetical protein